LAFGLFGEEGRVLVVFIAGPGGVGAESVDEGVFCAVVSLLDSNVEDGGEGGLGS